MEDAIIGRVTTHDADDAHGHQNRTSQSVGEPIYSEPSKILLAAGITCELVKPNLSELRAALTRCSAGDLRAVVDLMAEGPDGDHEYAEMAVDKEEPDGDHEYAEADDAAVVDQNSPSTVLHAGGHSSGTALANDPHIDSDHEMGPLPVPVPSAAKDPGMPLGPDSTAATPSPAPPTPTPNPVQEPDLAAPDNLVVLKKFDEATLLGAVKRRFERDEIYTLVGDMLLCVNPLKPLPRLYTAGTRNLYPPRLPAAADAAVPPHIFAVAQQAYANMTLLGRSQVVLVSGESGAGKTEASRLYSWLGLDLDSVRL